MKEQNMNNIFSKTEKITYLFLFPLLTGKLMTSFYSETKIILSLFRCV